jgi:hypothetical protein
MDFNRDWTFVKSSAEWTDDFIAEARAMEPVILPQPRVDSPHENNTIITKTKLTTALHLLI